MTITLAKRVAGMRASETREGAGGRPHHLGVSAGAIGAFRAFQPHFVEVPSDAEGMIMPALERALAKEGWARFIYVIPDFQNPTGRTWSRARRQALLDLAARYHVPIVEDCPYRDLSFEGEAAPSLMAMDRHSLVIHLGTCSKTLSPGLRVAWMTAPPAILEKYVLAKQGTDLSTSTFTQLLLADYLERADFDGHVARVAAECRRRRDAMTAALEHELPGVSFTRPRGGMFLWVELPKGLRARDLLPLALAHGVAFRPGDACFPSGGHENTLRLAYSDSPAPRIAAGIRGLGRAYAELVAREEAPAAAFASSR